MDWSSGWPQVGTALRRIRAANTDDDDYINQEIPVGSVVWVEGWDDKAGRMKLLVPVTGEICRICKFLDNRWEVLGDEQS